MAIKKKSQLFAVICILLCLSLLLSACDTEPPPAPEPEQPKAEQEQPESPPEEPPQEPPPPEPTKPPPPTEPPPTPIPEPTAVPTLPPLPADPQEIIFQAEDGFELTGYYLPAAVNPAPMIVLMHWAPGDFRDWEAIAPWLQNRGLTWDLEGGLEGPWRDASWFPPMLEGQSFGIFAFTFRYCMDGCSQGAREGWLLDAQAAMKTASELEGVDPDQLIGLGASIGADGGPDGCMYYNEIHPNGCQGSLSLSPGDYLTIPYGDAVKAHEEADPPKPVWCFYGNGDNTSMQTCLAAGGEHYRTFEYNGPLHGMDLVVPEADPDVLQLILDFLVQALGL